MALNEKPETVVISARHYIYVEKTGPFMVNAPEAWGQLHGILPQLDAANQITGYLSLYKPDALIYRAGVSLAAAPVNLPEGLSYVHFDGGKYSRFTLTGSYGQLGPATGRAFQLVAELKLPLRDDFNVENYLNDPRVTPVEELVTEILFPVD
jgi:effector-binding domain-containing protein